MNSIIKNGRNLLITTSKLKEVIHPAFSFSHHLLQGVITLYEYHSFFPPSQVMLSSNFALVL